MVLTLYRFSAHPELKLAIRSRIEAWHLGDIILAGISDIYMRDLKTRDIIELNDCCTNDVAERINSRL